MSTFKKIASFLEQFKEKRSNASDIKCYFYGHNLPKPNIQLRPGFSFQSSLILGRGGGGKIKDPRYEFAILIFV